ITHLLLQASTKDQYIQLDNFDVELPQGTLSVQGQATLTGDLPINMVANSTLNISPLKGEKITLNLGGGLREVLKVALNLSGPVGAQLDVQARLAEVGLPLAMTLQSKQLKWPLNGESQYQLNYFRLRFNGKAADY
ncbi:MAG: translocation and assembly module TamB, partial [Serratia symbiotica]|nr:translocation and assembly module TamB [Serratia symbiotica]